MGTKAKFLLPVNFFLLNILFYSIIACSSNTTAIDFDSDTWKKDSSGCQGQRLTMQEQVKNIRLQLLGKHEREIRALLGKPDGEELLERSNKIYLYYLTPGPKCNSQVKSTETIALAIRIEALGSVKEANLIKE